MIDLEEKLTGGNTADEVVRLGLTVRKPVTKSTPTVHSFLRHLRLTGYTGCPQALGIDEKGRQILEFIPGEVVHKAGHNIPIDLYRVGSLVRAFHEAAASFQPPADARWDPLSRCDREEIICHNDLAPWNLIVGSERWVFIDWDNAAPGSRLWDLAWTAISFPPIRLDGDIASTARAIRAIGDGYGLPLDSYRPLIDCMAERAQAASDHLLDGVRNHDPVAIRLYAEKHDEYWGPVADYLRRHKAEFEALIVPTVGSQP
jgi:hypothetical protein